MTPARPLAASVAVLGIAGVVGVPMPATAAPVPCARAERYAAQSGAELLRLNRLTLTPGPSADRPGARTTGGSEPPAPAAAAPSTTVGNVRVGEAKSAFVAEAAPNSAAVARMVNVADDAEPHEPLVQQAPPTNPEPARRNTPAVETGPLLVERGTLSSHAQWAPGMACGVIDGTITRASATLRAAKVVGIGGDVLVAVPGGLQGVSTTALARRADGTRTVAAATIGARRFELLNGAVTVTVTRPPTLMTRMSTPDGGQVGYVPAELEVSGDGIRATTLDTAGDRVELTIRDRDRRRAESGRVPAMGALGTGPPLPLPVIPGLPPVSTPAPEAASAEPGTQVRISLGDVRQAARGRSIAARASAVRVTIDERAPKGYEGAAATRLDLELGVLESAAVAPEPGDEVSGGASPGAAGAGGGLPVTGPRAGLLAVGGVLLLVGGAAMTIFGARRRRPRA